jgi:hypothetical protein
MLLKLTIPYHNRQFRGGVIACWHKTLGAFVAFGDDILDVDVQEIVTLKPVCNVQEHIEQLTQARETPHMDLKRRGENGSQSANVEYQHVTRPAAFSMTITASAEGFLRAILAKGGVACRVGDTVAIISTERDEPLDRLEDVLGQGSTFPTVPNPILR